MTALDRLSLPRFEPKPFALICPDCGVRSMAPIGARAYICVNPDCCPNRGGPGACIHMLFVDALSGARLLPWEEAVARDRIRKTDPRGALREIGGAR